MDIRDKLNFRKKNPKTVEEKLREEVDRARRWLTEANEFYDRIVRLDKLYPGVICTVDITISKRITTNNGVELPDGFLCSCKLLGMKVNEVERKNSYSLKPGKDFYISVSFYNEVQTMDCD